MSVVLTVTPSLRLRALRLDFTLAVVFEKPEATLVVVLVLEEPEATLPLCPCLWVVALGKLQLSIGGAELFNLVDSGI